MTPDPLIGKQLGDYTIVGLLGRGGMSRVYRGFDENLQRYAAVKVISSDFATTSEEEYTRRFQSEARAIAHLRHPNIVGIYQFGRSEGIYYMAQVFLEGKDLRMVLRGYAERGERMPTNEMLRIVEDIAAALDYAHAHGVIHRDVKPSNIMLERHTGRAILMDFGLALSVQEGTTGETFGSAHYIAPEQAVSSAKAVAQSDLYSLGVVIYEILTGQVPFDDPSAMSVALKHLNEAPPPPSRFVPTIPRAVEEVVLRALDKDPQKRYPSGRALVEALTAACASAEQPVIPAAHPSDDLLALIESPRHVSVAPPTGNFTPELAGGDPALDMETHGLARRFAERKAAKEELAAAQAAAADELQIDDQTLDSILSGYADPRDIGLVGPDATGIRPPEHPGSDNGTGIDRPPSHRLRRVLISAIIVLAFVAAGLVWANFLREDPDGPSVEPPVESELIAPPMPTDEAPAVAFDATGTATESVTENPAEDATAPAIAATDEATETRTPRATSTPRGETPTTQPATTKAAAPDAATAGPTTGAPSDTPTDPATATDTATPPPSRTPVAVSESSTPDAPDIRLIYGPDAFILLNLTDEPVDVSDLVFEQTGSGRYFEGAEWEGFVSGSPAFLEADNCLQLIPGNAPEPEADEETCPRMAGYFQTSVARRYFWRSEDANASFTVRLGEMTLATCSIAAGECTFSLPES